MATKVHPSVLQLGLKYADLSISGGNARCLAMLLVFKTVIEVICLSLCIVPKCILQQELHGEVHGTLCVTLVNPTFHARPWRQLRHDCVSILEVMSQSK